MNQCFWKKNRFIEIYNELNIYISWIVQTKKNCFEKCKSKNEKKFKIDEFSHNIWQNNKRYQSNMKVLNIVRDEINLNFRLRE